MGGSVVFMKLPSKIGISVFCPCWFLLVNAKKFFNRNLFLQNGFSPFLVSSMFTIPVFVALLFTWKSLR